MKTTQRHTPGPWHNYIAPHGTRHILPCPEPTLGTVQICTFNGVAHRAQGETEANARLIAAAPELLNALKNIEAALTFNIKCSGITPFTEQTLHQLRHVRAAIAKAEGNA